MNDELASHASEHFQQAGSTLPATVRLTTLDGRTALVQGLGGQPTVQLAIGHLAPGMDADIVIWDPRSSHTYGDNDLHDNVGYNPWSGRTIRGTSITASRPASGWSPIRAEAGDARDVAAAPRCWP